MIFIFNETDTIELVEAEWYSVEKIWQNEITLDYYYNVRWDTDLFKTNNSTAVEVENIPENKFNFAVEKVMIEWDNYKNLLKNKARQRIDKEVWDIYDLVADMSKRQTLWERLLMRVMLPFLKWEEIPQELKDAYIPMMEQYLSWIDAWVIRDRTDLEDANVVFAQTAWKITQIADIVNEEYISKI